MTIPVIDQLDPTQAGKEVTINQLLASLRASFTLTQWVSASTGLTIWFYGGRFGGTDLANQSLTLAASTTTFIYASATTGIISSSTVGYPGGSIALGKAVTSTVGITSYTPEQLAGGGATSSGGILLNSQSASYTTVAADANGCIYHPAADTTARTFTIAANSSVPYALGTAITFDNDAGAGALTIAITSDTLVLVGAAGSTGSRTLAAGGQATALKVGATRWRINGNLLT